MPKKKLTAFGRHVKSNDFAPSAVAATLGVTKSYVQALMTGAMTPGLKLAIEIQRWSKGTVAADSWVK